jgi:perosamine synthetase
VIPVYEPFIGDEEAEAVAAAVRAGEISGSFGENLPAFEREFADYVGARHGVATSSGTTALHLAVQALGLGPGDEVLVSASTNIATALAAYHNGAVAVPVDSEGATWNLNLDLVEGLITPRTRAIIPVHLFGHPVDMDVLNEIAERHGLAVVEDCAESHGATVRGRQTGSFGNAACFSFYANKIITTGEGGMVLTDDAELAERLRLLRNLAFGRPRFYHEQPGHNFRMTGYQAAMGRAQLRKIDRILAEKRRVAATYTRLLADVPGISTPIEEPWAQHVYWMYGVVVEDEFGVTRDELAPALAERGIETRTFFCPMNLQPFLRDQDGFRDVPCPVAEDLWRRGLYLPSSPSLTDEEAARIAAHLVELAAVRS